MIEALARWLQPEPPRLRTIRGDRHAYLEHFVASTIE